MIDDIDVKLIHTLMTSKKQMTAYELTKRVFNVRFGYQASAKSKNTTQRMQKLLKYGLLMVEKNGNKLDWYINNERCYIVPSFNINLTNKVNIDSVNGNANEFLVVILDNQIGIFPLEVDGV